MALIYAVRNPYLLLVGWWLVGRVWMTDQRIALELARTDRGREADGVVNYIQCIL